MPERLFRFADGIEQSDPALAVMQQLPRHSAVAGSLIAPRVPSLTLEL